MVAQLQWSLTPTLLRIKMHYSENWSENIVQRIKMHLITMQSYTFKTLVQAI